MILVFVKKMTYAGMALFPFVLIRRDVSPARFPVLVNHEKIHLRQQLEMLLLPFYFAYLIHYLINLVRYKNHDTAYRNVIFEKEAFANEADLNYLSQRRCWNFIKYH
jgi:hypothetical protein